MKPIVEKRTYETFGNTKEKTKSRFKINQSKEAFKILSSGLYSDKILAVIREYSANAWDSHKMAGKEDVPFEVHLPNTLEPYFSVKDFGVGLSHDEVLELFTTYFGSNKRNTNEATGMLGLGSKSAFSYTDQFTVTSRKDGKERTYTCYISDIGEPEVKLLSEKNTSESNGLEVYMSVEQGDFYKFKRKAQEVFGWYPVPPTITGERLEIEPPEIIREVELFDGIILKQLANFNRGTAMAVQGACAYPLDDKVVEEKRDYRNRWDRVNNSFSYGILIDFPIGSINITASREAIEYDKHTVELLKKVDKEIRRVMAEEVVKEISEVKTLWEACVKARDIRKTNALWYLIKDTVTWQKSKKSEEFKLSSLSGHKMELDLREDVQTTTTDGTPTTTRLSFADIRKWGNYEINFHTRTTLKNEGGSTIISPHKYTTIIVDMDRERQYRKKLKYHFKDNPATKVEDVYFIKPDEGREKDTWKAVNKQLKGAKIIKFSDLKEPPKEVLEKKKKLSPFTFISRKIYWPKAIQKSKDTGGIYLRTHRSSVDYFNDTNSAQRFIVEAVKLGVISEDLKVFFIPASYKNIPDTYDGWTHLLDFVEKKVKKKLKEIDIEELKTKRREKEYVSSSPRARRLVKTYAEYDKEFKKINKEVNRIYKFDLDKLLKLCKLLEDIQERKEEGFFKSNSEARKSHPDYEEPPEDTSEGEEEEVELEEVVESLTKIETLVEAQKKRFPLLFEYAKDWRQDEQFVDYINLIKKTERKST